MSETTRIVLARRPGAALADEDFRIETAELADLADGEFLLAVRLLSIDPAIRPWLSYDTYLPKIAIGEVIRSGGCGEVVATRNPKYPVGTRVTATTGWQTHTIQRGGYRIPDAVSDEDALSVFGMTGLTAYLGMTDIGRPQEGETVVVSGAAGAVGSIAGQIARIKGARVIGIAGSPEKCAWVVSELGFDECIDYRNEDVKRRLRELAPKGVDVYFDNVGGEILNIVLGQIRNHARIVLCGAISQYDREGRPVGPANLTNAISRRALLQGFIVLDHFDRAREANTALGAWVVEGLLTSRTDVRDGLAEAPKALRELFAGSNVGKLLVRV